MRLDLLRRTRTARLRDVDAELRFHLEERIDELVAEGMPRERAEALARERFGDVADVRAACEQIDAATDRRRSQRERLDALARQVRMAARALLRRPTFALIAIATLALGSGAATAVFSLVYGVLLRPLPFPEPAQLVAVMHTLNIEGARSVDQSDAGFLLYDRYATAFASAGVYRNADVNVVTGGAAGASGTAERVVATGVSVGLLPTLGVTPLLGRGFVTGEDRVGVPRVVVISEGMWRRTFGADPAIVGRRVTIDGAAREIVGVMPGAFRYPSTTTQLWFPLPLDPARATPGSFNYTHVARLRPGVTAERARAELARLLPRVMDEYPGGIPRAMFERVQLQPVVMPLRDAVVGDVGRLLWILLGSAVLVLLVACANVASLFLVRVEEGQRELAVRDALGAGRVALLTQYVGEALVLSMAGGAAGVVLAALAVRLLRRLPSGSALPRLEEVGIDGTVLLFALGTAVVSAVAVSVLPLLRARTMSVAAVLRDSGRANTAGARRQRARSTLVVAQVALALVLVAGSGLMARSFARLRDVRPGFDAEPVLAVRLALPRAEYATAASRTQLYERLLASVRALPGVREAGLTTWVPLTGDNSNSAVWVEDRAAADADAVPPVHEQVNVSGGWFAAMGVPLLAGRTLGAADAARPSTDVVVSRAFAERYWPGRSPLGKRIRPGLDGTPWYTIVGVVGDVHLTALDRPANDAVYLPLVTTEADTTFVPNAVALTIRTDGDPAALVGPVRQAVRALDATLPTYDERPMAATVYAAAARTRFTMLLLGVASAVALALGAIGIYGVMAYGVSLRQREIGVRMALGARPADVSRMISRQGVRLATAGVVIGLAGALVLTRFLRGLLYDVSPTDPLTLGATCGVLLGVALVASWLPARRAAALPPVEALRRD